MTGECDKNNSQPFTTGTNVLWPSIVIIFYIETRVQKKRSQIPKLCSSKNFLRSRFFMTTTSPECQSDNHLSQHSIVKITSWLGWRLESDNSLTWYRSFFFAIFMRDIRSINLLQVVGTKKREQSLVINNHVNYKNLFQFDLCWNDERMKSLGNILVPIGKIMVFSSSSKTRKT